jgi:hypothetical protein
VTPNVSKHGRTALSRDHVTLLVPACRSLLFLRLKRLFFGLEPVIDFGARLIAALYIEFVSAAANAFIERKLLDHGFLCAC